MPCLDCEKTFNTEATENTERSLLVQWDIQFGGELVGIKWAAGKKAVANLDRGDFSAAFVYLKDKVLGIDIFVDVHFDEFYAAILHELLGAAAIRAPTRAVHCDRVHNELMLAPSGGIIPVLNELLAPEEATTLRLRGLYLEPAAIEDFPAFAAT